ncbi:hypothetical protein [Fictibacillus sp. FJAT-27399]|uniref:hypothetical protein n=1 Tax=Fictibacillus sp. FJAT-27399 TaxID=1729689 RepID=UPI0012E38F39|nr:hypothetical protein [Fictibacillus sp. FJAT-27399]
MEHLHSNTLFVLWWECEAAEALPAEAGSRKAEAPAAAEPLVYRNPHLAGKRVLFASKFSF